MANKKQLIFIHGGMTFKNRADYLDHLKNREVKIQTKKRWHAEYLEEKLGRKFEIIRPRMPLADNAHYEEWKIHFERHFPFLKNKPILIGFSLGGIFLAKYLSENKFPKNILATYLIAPPFDNSLPSEDLVNGFKLPNNLSLLEKNTENLYLLFSQDDESVPLSQADKYRQKLSQADFKIFKSKNGHFKISTFPELIKMINKDTNNEC